MSMIVQEYTARGALDLAGRMAAPLPGTGYRE